MEYITIKDCPDCGKEAITRVDIDTEKEIVHCCYCDYAKNEKIKARTSPLYKTA